MVWINLNYMRCERNSNKEQYREYKNYPEKVNLWKQDSWLPEVGGGDSGFTWAQVTSWGD